MRTPSSLTISPSTPSTPCYLLETASALTTTDQARESGALSTRQVRSPVWTCSPPAAWARRDAATARPGRTCRRSHNEPADEPPFTITDSQIESVVPVRLAHLVGGRSPLPRGRWPAHRWRRPAGPTVRLSLIHEGVVLPPTKPHKTESACIGRRGADGRPQLAPLAWPLKLLPAVKVTFVLPLGATGSSASSVITAFTTRLDVPVDVDGVVYDHEFDPRVLTRDAAPGSPDRHGIPLRSLGLADRIVRAIRTQGWLHDDGTAILKGCPPSSAAT